MRSFTEPAVLLRAAIAAALTALACYPRLTHWSSREDAVWFLVAVIGWSAFVMWGAVFAWQERHGHVEVFPKNVPPKLWLITLALGVSGAAISFHLGDPTLRQLAPTDFPRNPGQWAEHVLFNLALEGDRIRFSFNAASNRTHAIEFRDAVAGGPWNLLTNLPALTADSVINITNPVSRSRDISA